MISFKSLGNLGRLGNSLFQLATTISLAMDNNDEYGFPPWPLEPYFNLHGCFHKKITPKHVYHEKHFHYEPIKYQPGMDLVGFFQSERYFENNKDVIPYLLTPKAGYGIQYDYTSIHVRRGDYLTIPGGYENLGMGYYEEAMKLIGSKHYMIFSDDIEWCKRHFIGDKFVFSEGRSAVEDLSLLLSCEHSIMANSSLSWWGSYLNKNPNKIVVAPKKWFGPAQPHDTKDLLPEEWIKI